MASCRRLFIIRQKRGDTRARSHSRSHSRERERASEQGRPSRRAAGSQDEDARPTRIERPWPKAALETQLALSEWRRWRRSAGVSADGARARAKTICANCCRRPGGGLSGPASARATPLPSHAPIFGHRRASPVPRPRRPRRPAPANGWRRRWRAERNKCAGLRNTDRRPAHPGGSGAPGARGSGGQ